MSQTPLTSRNIGETENALRAILLRVLAGTGLDYPRWIALQFVSLSPSTLSVDDVAGQLKSGLKLDDAGARDAIAYLEGHGILAIDTGQVLATPEGKALYQRLRDQIRPITEQLYAGLNAEDLAAARRVLATILERANALLVNWTVARSCAQREARSLDSQLRALIPPIPDFCGARNLSETPGDFWKHCAAV